MSTDLTSVHNCNLTHSGVVGYDDYLTKADYQRSRAKLLGGLLIATLVVNCIVAARLAIQAHQPPPIVGYASGYFFLPEKKPVVITAQSYFAQFRDTVDTLFRRTEKGSLPQLDDFVGDGVREYVDSKYTQVKDAYPSGFLQTYAVLDERVEAMSAREGAVMLYSGIYSVRSTTGMSSQPLYLRVTFKVGRKTELNGTGWRLSDIRPINEDDFYAEELEAQRASRLGLDPATKKSK